MPESLFKCCRIKTCNLTNKRLHNRCFPTNIAQILSTLTGIEIAAGHQTLSNKKCYMSSIHVSKPDNVLYSKIENHMRKILYVKTCLAHHIAYYKSIIKSHYTFIHQNIKWEHTHCRQLPLFSFPSNSGNTWSFYIQSLFKEY